MNVLGNTVIVTRLSTAHMLVSRPVLMLKRMSRLMIVSERRKPVRARCSKATSVSAMARSDAAPIAFTARERLSSAGSTVRDVMDADLMK